MPDDTFFQDDTQSDESSDEGGIQKVEKLKIGDGEYSQQELEELVSLGKIGKEAEEKFQTKIDKVWPNLQKTINEKKELEQQLADIQNQAISKKAETGQELSPEELARQARIEAKKLGIMTTDDFDQLYAVRRAGEKILDKATDIVGEASKEGRPSAPVEDLLQFMNERGFTDPQDAYDIMFKSELKQWEANKLKEVKPSGMTTIDRSNAGSKQPEAVKITDENLSRLVAEGLGGSN